MYTNRIYGIHWTVAFGLPLVVLIGLACAAFGEPPPPPTGTESNGAPIRVVANHASPAPAPSFALVSLVVRNTATRELRTLFAARTAADSRLYKVEFLSDGSAKLWQRAAMDRPFHLSLLAAGLGTNWVYHSFEAAEFRE